MNGIELSIRKPNTFKEAPIGRLSEWHENLIGSQYDEEDSTPRYGLHCLLFFCKIFVLCLLLFSCFIDLNAWNLIYFLGGLLLMADRMTVSRKAVTSRQ